MCCIIGSLGYYEKNVHSRKGKNVHARIVAKKKEVIFNEYIFSKLELGENMYRAKMSTFTVYCASYNERKHFFEFKYLNHCCKMNIYSKNTIKSNL